MLIKSLFIALLWGLPAWLGAIQATVSTHDWNVTVAWRHSGAENYFEAQSEQIVKDCRVHPVGYIVFPTIIQAAHIVELDGWELMRFGDPTFQTVRSYYGAPVLPCAQVKDGKRVTWKLYSYTKYFARVRSFPHVVDSPPLVNFYHETVYVIAAGVMLVLSLFCFVVFQGKIPNRLNFSLIASCLVLSCNFLWSVPAFFNITTNMLVTQKIADSSVWIGLCLFFYCLRLDNLYSKYLFYVFFAAVVIGCLMIIAGTDGDAMQTGTSLPFGFALFVATYALVKVSLRMRIHQESLRRYIFQALSLGIFVLACFNDVAVIEGYLNGYMILPIGIVSGLVFFALSVHEHIARTYEERDYLRRHLEDEVKLKTWALENTLKELKSAQSELIQNEKLVSLGTLSAGIAHEINNSLNYVNGSVKPLKKLIANSQDASKEKAIRLLDVMQNGLKMTFDIINSLRSYTGLNMAPEKTAKLKELVNNVVTLLKNRLINVQLVVTIDERLMVNTNLVSLQQVLMNLVSNAVDAMNGRGTLTITASAEQDDVVMMVGDSGCGISPEIRDRIFDPFFTTKDVGAGTGIGLHIVRTEVEKLHGRICVKSEVGKGATFSLALPIAVRSLEPSECQLPA